MLLNSSRVFIPREKRRIKQRLHLKIMLVLCFPLTFFVVDVTSSPIEDTVSRALKQTSFMANHEEESSSQDQASNFSNDNILPNAAVIPTSTYKLEKNSAYSSSSRGPVIYDPYKPMEFVVGAGIPVIRDFTKTTSEDTPTFSQYNKLKNLSSTLSDITFKPTTSEVISHKPFVLWTKSSTDSISKDILTRRVTPVAQYKTTRPGSENDMNSSLGKYYKDGKIVSLSEFKFKRIAENVTSPTEFHEYYSEPTIEMSMDDFLYELKEKKSNLSSNNQDMISNRSSKMTTPSSELLFSNNIKYVSAVTIESAESPKDRETNAIKELSMNATTSNGQNDENLDSFLSRRQDKSALIDNQQQGENFLPTSITPPLLSSNENSKFSDLPMSNLSNHHITVTISGNEASSNPDFKSEISTETVSTLLENHQTPFQNFTESTDFDILIENRTVILKEGRDYTAIIPRICSNYSAINRLLHLLNSSPNSKRTANFICEDMKNMKLAIKSKELTDKINEFLKAEAKTDDMVYIKFGSNSTIEFEFFPQSWFGGILFPKLIVIICINSLFVMCVTLACVVAFKKKCRKHSTSLDLRHIPHVNSKKDYNLAPIPRPSISFPDGSRDCLHAYTQDNYNRSRSDSSTLNIRNISSAIPKIYREVDNEIGAKQEMQTFTMSSGIKGQVRPSSSYDFATSLSWEDRQEKNYSTKYGVDNPEYRKW